MTMVTKNELENEIQELNKRLTASSEALVAHRFTFSIVIFLKFCDSSVISTYIIFLFL